MPDHYEHPYPPSDLESRFPFESLDFERLAPPEMARNAEEFFAQMDCRRSVRMFSSEPVSRHLIEQAVMTASTAPSGAHKQPWRFVATCDPVIKHEIRMAAEEEERVNYLENRMNDEWQRALAPLGTDHHKEFLEIAPWIVVLFEERYEVDTEGNRHKNYYVKESTGIAAGLFIAAIHNMGLATLPHTPTPMAFLSRTLGRPENERPFVMFPIGYPLDGVRVPVLARKSLDQVMAIVGEEPATDD